MNSGDFLAPLARLVSIAGDDIPLLAGVFARMSAVAFLAPGIGERTTPMRARLAAAFALTAIVAPVAAQEASAADPVSLAGLLGAETLAGLVIGFALRLAVMALAMAGTIAAQHISLSMLLGPGLGHEQETQLSTILIMGSLAVGASAGLHFEIAAALVSTYEIFPFGVAPFAGEAAEFILAQSASSLSIAFAMAAPFVILGFVYSLALAAMSRAMPQLMAAFVGAPAVIFAGLVLFAGTASIIVGRWNDLIARLLTDFSGGLK